MMPWAAARPSTSCPGTSTSCAATGEPCWAQNKPPQRKPSSTCDLGHSVMLLECWGWIALAALVPWRQELSA